MYVQGIHKDTVGMYWASLAPFVIITYTSMDEGGSIGPTAGKDNTATLKLNIPLYCPTQKECNNDLNLVGIH